MCMLPLQVLLAVAQGAYILTPEWVTASLEAGEWLPEDEFISKVKPPRAFQIRATCGSPHVRSCELTCFLLRQCISPTFSAERLQVRYTETAERVRRERLLPRSLPPLVGKRVYFQTGATRDPAELASLRRLVAALGAKASMRCPSQLLLQRI